jgi:hypothetical protein
LVYCDTKSGNPALFHRRKTKILTEESFFLSELDTKVKSLLLLNPAKFTEWLMGNGLIPVEQVKGRRITASQFNIHRELILRS